ncbi:hypothetical protein [Jannaschia aquimarina]|uniref:DUF2157 domain-containing protein n=1 Tax=Jannaschia aquimarina TaxID=935700 RepID=A0A0D1D4G0_9RHOB|nr:hypothetical protein [Jannaschia aquimarina]KIT14953.1 hypothetical protein jaqu_32780 [Jannaschia aquimarina]SNS60295.1 hypothetical protein SAMN05421775_101603 [Jannaschia aquimarina]
MIERDDLRAAVSAGLLTEMQAGHLTALADARRGTREAISPGEEPFELFRGFNEIFIVAGLLILSTGWWLMTGIAMIASDGLTGIVLMTTTGAGLVCLLSEYFIRRRRMVAPAIMLTILFTMAAATAARVVAGGAIPVLTFLDPGLGLVAILSTIVALLGYFLRYRVPFALALIAILTFLATFLVVAETTGTALTWIGLFNLAAGSAYAWATLVLGLVVFAIAMRFDMSDPHRVTRRSANGFWLHIVAAPAIVNTMAISLLADPTTLRLTALAGILALLALVALVIDRRSFLVSGAGYTVALAGFAGSGAGIAFAILAMGAGLVLLGAAWERIRAVLMDGLGDAIPRDRLPPAHHPDRIRTPASPPPAAR